jgi:CHASE2 domain-containing sensor protein
VKLAARVRTPHAQGPFWKYLLRPAHIVLVVGVLLAVQFLEHWGWLEAPSAALIDSFTILTQGEIPSNVVLVEITEEDYREVFKQTSPLDPQLVSRLVETASRFHPLAVGVDIDTSSEAFTNVNPSTGSIPVVWAVGARSAAEQNDGHREPGAAGILNPFQERETEIVAEPVLGRDWSPDLRAGVSVFAADADTVVRRYSRGFRVATGGGHARQVESFPMAVFQAARGATAREAQPSAEPVLIRFPPPNHGPVRLPASFVLHAAAEHAASPDKPWPALLDRFRGRVVLIGGTYAAARDLIATPNGRISGLSLIAAAVETELAGGGMGNVHRLATLILDIGLAVLLIYFGYALTVKMMLIGGAGVIIGVTMLSFFVFSSGLVFLNAAPLLVGVLLHQWGHRFSGHGRTNGHRAAPPPAGTPSPRD